MSANESVCNRFSDGHYTALRRPGQLCVTKSYNDLVNAVNDIVIQDVISGIEIKNILETVNSIKSILTKEVFNSLYKEAIKNRLFGTKLAIVFNKGLFAVSSELKNFLMITLQNNYQDREEIKKRSYTEFRNTVSFFGEMFNILNVHQNLVKHLAVALIDYLEMLLDSSEEEDIEIASIQIFINGRKMHEKCPDELQKFLVHVKKVLINYNLSAKSRGMLLFIIDLANQYFIPLTGKLKDFYTNEIGIDKFIDIQQNEKQKNFHVIRKLTTTTDSTTL